MTVHLLNFRMINSLVYSENHYLCRIAARNARIDSRTAGMHRASRFIAKCFIVNMSLVAWLSYSRNARTPFVIAEMPRMYVCTRRGTAMINDHGDRSGIGMPWGHARGSYKWIASPGLYLTGNINGQMRFCRRERMARGRVSIYPRRTILSRRTRRRYTPRDHYDGNILIIIFFFFPWKMFP